MKFYTITVISLSSIKLNSAVIVIFYILMSYTIIQYIWYNIYIGYTDNADKFAHVLNLT